jgi:Uma2 family endonuclease
MQEVDMSKAAWPNGSQRFTYEEYRQWPPEERWELIDGRAYGMTPAPSTNHQTVVSNVHFLLRSRLKDTPCRVFSAPTDVVLSEYDVVQPDVLVICDPGKITPACIQGRPDLVVEVLSPSTVLKDRREKKRLYEGFGVPEYVLLHLDPPYAEHYILGKDALYGREETLGPDEVLTLALLGGVEIELKEVFANVL